MKYEKFDTYTIYARLFPGVLTIIPFFVLWFFLRKDMEILNLEKYLLNIKITSSITILVVLMYINAMIIRQVSKYYESKYFIKKEGFPTTYLMTYKNNTFSKDYKNQYREKIKRQFDIKLLNEIEEAVDYQEAIKLLNEASKQVVLYVKDGHLVKQHNIWYGFSRNLIGGTIIGTILCLINIILGLLINIKLSIISTAIIIIYVLIFLFRKSILEYNAEAYAKQLIAEYIQSPGSGRVKGVVGQ